MALFLQEAQQVETPVVTLHEAMEAMLEFVSEQAAMNEALLRADFIIHEQTRVLREAGDEEAASGKEKGFMGKALDLLKKLIEKAKSMISTVYNYIKGKVQAFWAWLKKTYAGVKEFAISKYNLAMAKAKAAMAAARLRVGLRLVSGEDAGNIADAVEKELAGVTSSMKAAEGYAKDTSWEHVGEAELEALTKAGTQVADDAQKAIERANQVVKSGNVDAKKAEAIKAGLSQLEMACRDASAVLEKGLKVRAKAAAKAEKAEAKTAAKAAA